MRCLSLISTVSTLLLASIRNATAFRTQHLCLKASCATPADFASQLQERLQGLEGGGNVNAVVHELLAATTRGAETPGSRPPAPTGRNSRPNSREVPKVRNPLAPLPTDTHNRRPSSRQGERTTPGSFRKVPPVPTAPSSDDSGKRRPLSREQRRRVEARRKRESTDSVSDEPFGPSPTWSSSRAQQPLATSDPSTHPPIHPSIHATHRSTFQLL